MLKVKARVEKKTGAEDWAGTGRYLSIAITSELIKPASEPAKTKRGQHRQFKAPIPKGEKVFSTLKEGVSAVSRGDGRILFRGEDHSYTSAAKILARETGRNWPSIQGPLYWTYKGRKLTDLR
jgi:hypothetical protein